jgi:hypothetical protein
MPCAPAAVRAMAATGSANAVPALVKASSAADRESPRPRRKASPRRKTSPWMLPR